MAPEQFDYQPEALVVIRRVVLHIGVRTPQGGIITYEGRARPFTTGESASKMLHEG